MNESEKLRESVDLINRMLTTYKVAESDPGTPMYEWLRELKDIQSRFMDELRELGGDEVGKFSRYGPLRRLVRRLSTVIDTMERADEGVEADESSMHKWLRELKDIQRSFMDELRELAPDEVGKFSRYGPLRRLVRRLSSIIMAMERADEGVEEADSKVSPDTDDMWDVPSSKRTDIGEGHFSREDVMNYILEDLAKISDDDLWEVQEIVKGLVNKPEPKSDFYKPYNAPPRRTLDR